MPWSIKQSQRSCSLFRTELMLLQFRIADFMSIQVLNLDLNLKNFGQSQNRNHCTFHRHWLNLQKSRLDVWELISASIFLLSRTDKMATYLLLTKCMNVNISEGTREEALWWEQQHTDVRQPSTTFQKLTHLLGKEESGWDPISTEWQWALAWTKYNNRFEIKVCQLVSQQIHT